VNLGAANHAEGSGKSTFSRLAEEMYLAARVLLQTGWDQQIDASQVSIPKKANVQTNGYYTDRNPKVLGTTGHRRLNMRHLQVAMSDDDNYGNINTFLGNYGYARSSIGDTKDALFAIS
jgi:hypothetical protein